MFIHIHCNAVVDGLVPDGLCRGGVECTKKGVPVLFTQVIDKIVHEPCSCQAPEFSVELLARGNEISTCMHFVGTFNLDYA